MNKKTYMQPIQKVVELEGEKLLADSQEPNPMTINEEEVRPYTLDEPTPKPTGWGIQW